MKLHCNYPTSRELAFGKKGETGAHYYSRWETKAPNQMNPRRLEVEEKTFGFSLTSLSFLNGRIQLKAIDVTFSFDPLHSPYYHPVI